MAAGATTIFHPASAAIPGPLLIALDAAGLALFAVAGTEKSLHHGIPRLPAIFLGTISGVGGGTIRDVLLNVVPTVLRADVYATAALVAAILVVTGRALRLPPAVTGIIAALACFTLRMAAVAYDWQLPRPD